MSLVLVADIGTTNTKVGLIDKEGNVITYKERENPIERPEQGAAEHDPNVLYKNFIELSREVTKDYRDKVSTIALSAYQLGLLPISKDGTPLMNIITLLDTRPQDVFPLWSQKVDMERLYKNTGCSATSLYPLSKVVWLRERRPEIFKNTGYFLSSKDWLMYRLTGDVITEPSIASATQLFNMGKMEWDEYAMEIAGISPSRLPKIVSGNKIYGKIRQEVREEIGLKRDVSLLPGVYDGGGILIGVGGLDPQIGVVNLGTSAMVRIISDIPVLDDKMRLQTYGFFKDLWLTGAGINNAGIALKWLRYNVLNGEDYESLTKEAEEVKEGAEGLFFLPYLSGERDPRIGNLASGVVFGIREYHRRAHIVRAILEGVAYTANLVIEVLSENDIAVKQIRIGGSGARSDLWLSIFANVLNLPVQRAKKGNAALLGEALLAFVADGTYKDYNEATEHMVELEKPFISDAKSVEKYNKLFSLYKELIGGLKPLYETVRV